MLFSLIVLIDVLVLGLGIAAIVLVIHGHGSESAAANQAPSLNQAPSFSAGAYPASGQKSFLSDCESGYDSSTSQCQCELNWVEASVPYATWVKNEDFWDQDAGVDSDC
jgi:hypothetical protein